MSTSKTTTDHDEIRKWAEARGGKPARVRDTSGDGILRLDFGDDDEGLEEIDWETFFDAFEKNDLALLHQDQTSDGETSRFNKLVSRNG
jgi:hypothetical protein